jgi:hypothetical protein
VLNAGAAGWLRADKFGPKLVSCTVDQCVVQGASVVYFVGSVSYVIGLIFVAHTPAQGWVGQEGKAGMPTYHEVGPGASVQDDAPAMQRLTAYIQSLICHLTASP